MSDEHIRKALDGHWQASASGDLDRERLIYAEEAVSDYRRSGERILGRRDLRALWGHHPGKPSGFEVRRISGAGDLRTPEYTITYQERSYFTVSMMEFQDGKVVHETQYFAEPFSAPWRRDLVSSMP